MDKNILFSALSNKMTERVPWVPFVGCHGGKLIGRTAREYLSDAGLIVSGISRAIELYRPDGIPVMFDLQLEAEALGCKLSWSERTPPAVITHPLAEGLSLEDLKMPGSRSSRIPVALETVKKIKNLFPEVGIYGLVTGPFTLGLHLLGTDIFIRMLERPGEVHTLMEFCANVSRNMADMYISQGCDIIALVDPMTSQIDPFSFENFVLPHATPVFEYIRSRKVFSSFFVCGHAQQNIEVMCRCKPDNISIDENIPLEFVKEVTAKYNISFGGNLKLTMVLLHGTEEDVQREAIECMDIGGNRGFILAPGCDLPYDTPPGNLKAITRLISDPYQQEVIRALDRKTDGFEKLNMKDYGIADKVIVDIITLDSESCAPCQYMVEAVKKIAPHFEGIVEWREHPIKKIEGISFMSSLMVKNIPTICIDGKITFVSIIPPRHELIAAIQRRINEKLKLKIKSRKGEILVIGRDQQEFAEILNRLHKALEETGREISVRQSTDPNLMATFGIIKSPAVVLTEFRLKSEGEIPSVDVIKEWIKSV